MTTKNSLIKLFYRIITPNNPRGKIDVNIESYNQNLRVFTDGMSKFHLPDVEIVNIPNMSLAGNAHAMIFDITGYMVTASKTNNPIKENQTLSGQLVNKNQRVHHSCKFIKSPNQTTNNKILRVVDITTSTDDAFPSLLFATHLCTLASINKSTEQSKRFYIEATQIHQSILDTNTLTEEKFLHTENYNNFAAWEGLAELEYAEKNYSQAINYYKEAAKRCPYWALDFGKFLKNEMSSMDKKDPDFIRFNFFTNLTSEQIASF